MPFSLLRNKIFCIKSLFPILGFILVSFVSSSALASEQISVKGVYPNFTATQKIILKPRANLENCQKGHLYVDLNGDLQTCDQGGALNSKIWAKSGTNVYTKEKTGHVRDEQKVSIGNNNAWAQFNIYGRNSANEAASIFLLTSDNLSNTGIILRNSGTIADSANYAAAIDFHVGDRGKTYDARIVYLNRLTGPKGMSLRGGFNINNVWIDTISHNVGIGTNQPAYKLDVNGDLEANKIFLKSDGTHTAVLKTEYGDGGHYAVYAP